MDRALIDSDIYSEIIKGIDADVARNALSYKRAHGRFTISAVTVMEGIQGLQRIGAAKRIRAFRSTVATEEVLPFDEDIADLAGLIAGDLDRAGRPIGRCDPMIAAVAIRHGLELVTGNVAHYQYVRNLGYHLPMVNWRL